MASHSAILNIHRSGVPTALLACYMAGAIETAAFWAHALCTPYNPAPVYTVSRNHVPGVYVCLAVTWHFYFWQNDRDLLRVTALTRGLNGYRNESTQKVDPGEKKSSRSHDSDLLFSLCCCLLFGGFMGFSFVDCVVDLFSFFFLQYKHQQMGYTSAHKRKARTKQIVSLSSLFQVSGYD